MGRPRKEKYEIEECFLEEALLLANSYSMILIEQQDLQNLLSGNFVYTEDMAIQELLGGGQQEGERVQTSNISNIPERIAILMADGYAEKKRKQMQREAQQRIQEYRELCGKIQIVETAMAERMDARTRAVFRQVYIEHRQKSLVVDEYRHRLYRQQVDRAIKDGITGIAEEMAYQDFVNGCQREDGVSDGQT